jgi:hypothetical protein
LLHFRRVRFPFSDMTPACGPGPLQYLPFEGTGVSFGLNIEVFYERGS